MAEMKTLLDHLGILLNQLSDKENVNSVWILAVNYGKAKVPGLPNNKTRMAVHTSQEKQKIRDKKGRIKNKMFNRIKMARFMKIKQEPQGVSGWFLGNVALLPKSIKWA